MIDYLSANIYVVLAGFVAAFIVAYKLVQNINSKYEFDDVNPRSLFLVKAVLTVAPFLLLAAILFIFS